MRISSTSFQIEGCQVEALEGCQVEALETFNHPGNVAFREPQCDKVVLETFDHFMKVSIRSLTLREPQGDRIVKLLAR